MLSKIVPILLGLMLSAAFLNAAADGGEPELQQEAIGIVKRFAGSLKPELKKAIQQDGFAHAISVCAETAPALARDLAEQTGWYVKRVSLRARNRETATPDAWEKRILEQFDRRQAKGEAAADISFAEVIDGRFRFMKAQGVEPVCLNCHAAEVDPEVEAALREKYPLDRARGYSLGQIRGAFSLARDL